MKTFNVLSVAVLSCVLLVAGCSTTPKSESKRAALEASSEATLTQFRSMANGDHAKLVADAKAVAVFPSIAKGAAGIGGAYGRGVLYEGGVQVGYAEVTQGTIGFQLGGQAFSEVIVFHTDDAVKDFKAGHVEFDARATAVAADASAAADTAYPGVQVYIFEGKGLMYEAAIGGQKFDYEAK